MTGQDALKKFNKLYNDTYNDILKYVVCRCTKIDDIEDIMQNIYLYVYKNLLKNKDVNMAYIMGIAKNKVNDYYRFRYKEKIISFFENHSEEKIYEIQDKINVEESVSLKFDTELVWNYLKSKRIIIFKVFFLYYKCEMKISDIAKYLEITEVNVKNYLYRTLRELNEYLESEGKDDA